RQMNSIPSVIIDAGIYSGGYCYVYLRFHSAEAGKVSAAIGNLQPDLERFAIRYMGESNGLIGTFQELSDILSLKYVEIAATVPPDYMNITQDQVITTLGVSWERELKYLLGDEFRAVFYDRHNIIQNKKGDVNVISQEHRIYESAFSNPLVQFMIEETSSRGIVTLGMQQKLDGRNFSFATVVPDAVLPEFFNVFRQGQEKFRPWDMKVTNVESIDSMPV
ncbi:MAG TPA: hypothetical protein VKU79_06440, partial [Thermoplasmataceae archaeon]|nr:hypothetical protein [Thermoplasmataceae archaeon]